MKLAVIMVTHARSEMFERAVRTLRAADGSFSLWVFAMDKPAIPDCSQDVAIDLYQRGMIDHLILEEIAPNLHRTFRRGIEAAMAVTSPDAFLLTADDYEFKPTWYEHTVAVLSDDRFSHITLDIEPPFPWNAIRKQENVNGVDVLIRDTVPGALWAMTLNGWRNMRTIFRNNELATMCDHHINSCMRAQNRLIGAIDEAEHVGAYLSTVANNAYHKYHPVGAKVVL